MEGRVIPEPYIYPSTPHVRRHGPRGWKDYQRYRPWLRDEFTFRCVYCLDREIWRDMREAFHIDHLIPQQLRPDLKNEYNNLLYLCPACNHEKSNSILPNPCVVALASCLRIEFNGKATALNGDGERLIEILDLNHPSPIERRRIKIGEMRSYADGDWPKFVEQMGFPKNLPNLNHKDNKPPHNDKPEGVAQSFYEQQQRDELPEVY